MQLKINGNAREFDPPLTLLGLIEKLGMKPDRVAVELNRRIIAREQWASITLAENDQLEVVHFVGGGTFVIPAPFVPNPSAS